MLSSKKIRSGLIFSLVLAIVVMTAIALYGDLPQMVRVLARFRWEFLPLILGLALYNYFWRFLKWQYYLRRLRIRIDWRKSLLIFISGLSMAITPGKVGELLKCYLLKRSTGEPISRTSPIVMAERLTDGIAMLGLSATGLILYRYGVELLLAFLVVVFIGLMIIQNRPIALALIGYGEKLPFLFRIAHFIRTFYESSYTLLRWRPLLFAILIGLISWLGECGALYFVFAGLGLGFGFDLFFKATFIMAFSSLVGSATGLPGGLGTADGSMIGLMRLLVSASATIGGAATLLIRLCTLWFGLGLGVIALIILRSTQSLNIREEDKLVPVHLADDAGRSGETNGDGVLLQEEEGQEEQEVDNTGIVPTGGRSADLHVASALLNTGDKGL
ncbi:MAG TPA: lysylphosphatidylglycerol synthase transmembrane domain-containing protein [Ktedonobacteraceae bacterium]